MAVKLKQASAYAMMTIIIIIIIIIGTTAPFEPRPSSEASATCPYSLQHVNVCFILYFCGFLAIFVEPVIWLFSTCFSNVSSAVLWIAPVILFHLLPRLTSGLMASSCRCSFKFILYSICFSGRVNFYKHIFQPSSRGYWRF